MTPSGIEPKTFRLVAQCINPLNAELNPICHLLALLGAHHILHVSRIRDNQLRHRVPLHRMEYFKIIDAQQAKENFRTAAMSIIKNTTTHFSKAYYHLSFWDIKISGASANPTS
jgi:hypothetical protein